MFSLYNRMGYALSFCKREWKVAVLGSLIGKENYFFFSFQPLAYSMKCSLVVSHPLNRLRYRASFIFLYFNAKYSLYTCPFVPSESSVEISNCQFQNSFRQILFSTSSVLWSILNPLFCLCSYVNKYLQDSN